MTQAARILEFHQIQDGQLWPCCPAFAPLLVEVVWCYGVFVVVVVLSFIAHLIFQFKGGILSSHYVVTVQY